MPKRIPTPPPPDDEPRYLTVVHPYPLHANLQLHADRRTLALWLACCTGKEVLLAMYHKPTSPGMVIMEVDRSFDRFESLLGMHAWVKFLAAPTEEEKGKESKVFWCHYNSGRLVQKNGWKRVDIEEYWFKDWSPYNKKIKFPYPKTTRCDVPIEAQTGVPLCRPLPQTQFPVPPPAPQPRVGSAEWISAKSSDAASDVTSSSRKKKGNKAAPSDTISVISSASGGPRPPPPPAASPVSAWQMATHRATQGGAWNRGPPSIASIVSSSASRAPSVASSVQGSRAPSTRSSAPPSTRPPGLAKQPNLQYEHFDWGEEVDRFEEERDNSPSTPSARSNLGSDRYTAPPPRHVPDPDGPIDPDQNYEYEEQDLPKRSMAEAMKGLLDGDDDDDDDDYAPNPTFARAPANNGTVSDKDPWNGYDAPRWEPPSKINRKGKEKEEWECPEHGPMCNPGICKVRARLERERRWEKERNDREEAKKLRLEKREKERLKKERKLAKEEGREVRYDQPPHLANGPRSATSTSTSGSGSETEGDGSRNRDSESGPDDDRGTPWDDDDDAPPKVNLGRRPTSVPDTDGDGETSETRSMTSSSKTKYSGSDAKIKLPKSQLPKSPLIEQLGAIASVDSWSAGSVTQSPWKARGAASGGGRSTTLSTSGDVPAQQRQPALDTRSAASTRPPVSSVGGSNKGRSIQGDDSGVAGARSPPLGKRQPSSESASESSSRVAAKKNTSPEWDTRSSATRHSTSTVSTAWRERPSVAPPVVVSRPAARDDDDARSSVSVRTAVSSNPSFDPVPGGFPTYSDQKWGDPIAYAQQNSRRKSSSGSGSGSRSGAGAGAGAGKAGEDESVADESEAGRRTQGNDDSENVGPGRASRGRRGGKRGGWGAARRGGPAAAVATKPALPSVLDVQLPPGGPGSSWGEPGIEW